MKIIHRDFVDDDVYVILTYPSYFMSYVSKFTARLYGQNKITTLFVCIKPNKLLPR